MPSYGTEGQEFESSRARSGSRSTARFSFFRRRGCKEKVPKRYRLSYSEREGNPAGRSLSPEAMCSREMGTPALSEVWSPGVLRRTGAGGGRRDSPDARSPAGLRGASREGLNATLGTREVATGEPVPLRKMENGLDMLGAEREVRITPATSAGYIRLSAERCWAAWTTRSSRRALCRSGSLRCAWSKSRPLVATGS